MLDHFLREEQISYPSFLCGANVRGANVRGNVLPWIWLPVEGNGIHVTDERDWQFLLA